MSEQETGWKQALVDYVTAVNEAIVLGQTDAYRRIPDAEHRHRLIRRSLAVSSRAVPGQMRPIRSEVRARIVQQHYSDALKGKEAQVDLLFHSLRSYEQRSQPWLEERYDKERIRFVHTGRRWRIDSIQPLAGEWQASAYYGDEESGLVKRHEDENVSPSLPHIPARVRYGSGPRVYAGAGTNGFAGGLYRDSPYRREAVAAYAEQWWDKANPAYELFEVNCTNYVSQCIFAGGAPMNYTGKRESGWWYKGLSGGNEQWSFSWAVANSLQHYMSQSRPYGLRAEAVASPDRLMLGDVICYDWDGNGQFRHNTIVTAFTPEGMPLVNANTVPSRHRYWDYRDSYAWTDNTRYRFYHITEAF